MLLPVGGMNIRHHGKSTGIPIDDWRFAAGYIAKRRLDRTEWLVIRTPGGIFHYYRYRSVVGIWERYSPYEDPSLDKCVQRFGPRLGSLVRGGERAATRTVQELVQTLLTLVSLAIGHIQMCLKVGFVLGVLLLIRLVIGLFTN